MSIKAIVFLKMVRTLYKLDICPGSELDDLNHLLLGGCETVIL